MKSGKYKVIINNEVFADILDCFSDSFSGDSVNKGFSLLKGRQNTKIANDNITLLDEPLMKDGISSCSFDSEGVATYNKAVIENGVLKTYLHNIKSAAAMGVKSTGNGFKGSYKTAVGVSPTNFYIKPGEDDFEKALSEMGEGLVITDVAGLHSGANTVSGDFSLAAEGFAVKDGKISAPVEQITIADNFFELLKKAHIVCSDLKFNTSAVGSPSIMFEEIAVSGL